MGSKAQEKPAAGSVTQLELLSTISDTQEVFEAQQRTTSHFFKQLSGYAVEYVRERGELVEKLKLAEDALESTRSEDEKLKKQVCLPLIVASTS